MADLLQVKTWMFGLCTLAIIMEVLARIIVEDVLVFAYSNEDQIDDDFSVSQLERIAHQIRSSDSATIDFFVQVVNLMQWEATAQGLEERSEQIAAIPHHLGL